MQTTDQAPPSSSIRYDKLLASHQACLQSIAKECSLAKFAEALPMLQRNNPELLKELRDTVMNEWMTKTRSDFLDSVQDRELFPLLAGLDALAATASDKRADSGSLQEEGDANAAELEPVTVMMSHRYALKQAEKARLLELLQQDVDENQQLFSQVQSQAAELEELSRRVQELKSGLLPVEDYLAAGEVLDFDTNFGPQTISLLELFSSSNLLELSWEIKKSLSGASPIRTISLLPSYANVAFNPRGDQSMDPSYIYAMFCASIVYLVWQGLYYYFILVFDLSHATSYTYLLTDYMGKKKNNPLTKLFKATPEAFRPFLFIIVQFIYALLTMLPTVVYYRSFWAHTAFIVFIVMLSVFNGADYYMEGNVSQLTSSL
ncbi:hypothetical protein HDU91_001679 [Kappamyces sp. JEL0680]|nr:hypothetical protein HDU91_001679 [Kappamyces sp. JEL0680]